jgi:hypothetical protein
MKKKYCSIKKNQHQQHEDEQDVIAAKKNLSVFFVGYNSTRKQRTPFKKLTGLVDFCESYKVVDVSQNRDTFFDMIGKRKLI